MQETQETEEMRVQSLGQEYPLEEEMATYSDSLFHSNSLFHSQVYVSENCMHPGVHTRIFRP